MDKEALFNLSYGVYVVSSKDNERNVGCIVNSIFQVTSSPMTVAISINKNNYTHGCILKSKKFAISILSEQADNTIIGTFGFKTSKDTDKFAGLDFTVTGDGLPALTAKACSYLTCNVINSVDCFTHTVVIAEITDAVSLNHDTPMTYSYYHKVIKGKAPKNAPTYVEETASQAKEAYVCDVCGYIHTGTKEEFEALPDSYACPVCSVPKSSFSLKTV